jgi:hypothetical protein
MATTRFGARIRHFGWRALLASALLTQVFMLGADLLSRALGSVSIAPVLSVVAFLLAGLVAQRLSPTARPIEPALGSAAAVLIMGVVQLTMLGDGAPVSAAQMAVFITTLTLAAFVCALLGARLSKVQRARRFSP